MNGDAHLGSEPPSAEPPLDRLEAFVEDHPVQALAVAVGAGLAARLLPKRATAAVLGRLLVRAVPPALLTLGALKAVELLAQSQPASRAARR
jgi:hypothetical protein